MQESAVANDDYFLLWSLPQPLACGASSAYKGVGRRSPSTDLVLGFSLVGLCTPYRIKSRHLFVPILGDETEIHDRSFWSKLIVTEFTLQVCHIAAGITGHITRLLQFGESNNSDATLDRGLKRIQCCLYRSSERRSYNQVDRRLKGKTSFKSLTFFDSCFCESRVGNQIGVTSFVVFALFDDTISVLILLWIRICILVHVARSEPVVPF